MTSTIDPRTQPLPVTRPVAARGTARATAPPRPVPPAGAPPSPRPRRRRGVTLAAGVVALAAATGTAAGFEGLDGADRVQYQTVSSAGANPFTAPVGTDAPGVTTVSDAGGERPGDTPQMYAADPAAPTCDVDALLAELQVDPARAAVWAQVQRIAPDEIPAFVGGLTPVVLRAETAVVDHGFRDGAPVPTPAVLAAGTAVFVNSYGQPTVKCFSGNPLTPRASTDPAVTTVTPTARPIARHTFHHPATSGPVTVPGTPDPTGDGPTPFPPSEDPATPDPTTPDPSTPDPVTQGPAQPDPGPPPVTGTYNPDGSITLSDGRIRTTDGRIVELPPIPADAVPLPDGGYRDASGVYRNRDGSPREEAVLSDRGSEAILLLPDGTVVDGQGYPVRMEREMTIVRGHDGTVLVITDNPGSGSDEVVLVHRGRPINIITGTYRDGVITDGAGRVLNPDGSERRPVTLPGGGQVLPDGTNVPPPGTGTPHGRPGTGTTSTPTATPTSTPPIDPPIDPSSGPRRDGSVREGAGTGEEEAATDGGDTTGTPDHVGPEDGG